MKSSTIEDEGSTFLQNIRCSRTFLVYLFLRFASISYGRFVAIHCKLNLSSYVQELLVIGRRGCTGRD